MIATTSDRNLYIKESADTFKVSRQVFSDAEIFEREQKAVFATCWLYVGHASEVAEPGAFRVRRVGHREVIFNRDSKGNVNAFINACPHRGARLCTERAGTAKSFHCYYHGWAFATDGALRVLPEREAFPADFNHDGSANMTAVPRIEEYRGLYFVCFDRNAMSLADYLGDAKPHIDLLLDQGESWEVVPGSQEYSIRANWKTLAENGVDGNHAEALHASYFEYARTVMPAAQNLPRGVASVQGVARGLGHGHAMVEYSAPWGRAAGRWSPVWGEESRPEIEAAYTRLVERVGTQRADAIVGVSRNLLIFPNLTIVDSTGLTIRVAHPIAPDAMQVSSFAIAPKEESAVVRKLRLFNFIEFLGPGGYATPDDIEALEQCQRAYAASASEPGWNDLSKGSLSATEWPLSYEGHLRGFWREWAAKMNGEIG